MNALTTQTTGTAVAMPAEANPFAQYETENRRTSIVGDLLKFNKGDWLAGQDEREIDEGTRFVANMDELFVGWIRWEDKKPTEQLMGRVADNFKPARRSELGDTDKEAWPLNDDDEPQDPWQQSNYLLLRGVDDEQLYTFTAGATGSRGAITELCGAYGREMRSKPDQYPVVEIGTGKYKHATYGWIKFPTFKVVGWSPKSAFRDALEEAQADAAADEANRSPTAETAARGRSKAAPREKTVFPEDDDIPF